MKKEIYKNGLKTCTHCRLLKKVEEFYHSIGDYVTSECKECKKKKNKEYDAIHVEQKRKRAREYERRKANKK